MAPAYVQHTYVCIHTYIYTLQFMFHMCGFKLYSHINILSSVTNVMTLIIIIYPLLIPLGNVSVAQRVQGICVLSKDSLTRSLSGLGIRATALPTELCSRNHRGEKYLCAFIPHSQVLCCRNTFILWPGLKHYGHGTGASSGSGWMVEVLKELKEATRLWLKCVDVIQCH